MNSVWVHFEHLVAGVRDPSTAQGALSQEELAVSSGILSQCPFLFSALPFGLFFFVLDCLHTEAPVIMELEVYKNLGRSSNFRCGPERNAHLWGSASAGG